MLLSTYSVQYDHGDGQIYVLDALYLSGHRQPDTKLAAIIARRRTSKRLNSGLADTRSPRG